MKIGFYYISQDSTQSVALKTFFNFYSSVNCSFYIFFKVFFYIKTLFSVCFFLSAIFDSRGQLHKYIKHNIHVILGASFVTLTCA